MRNEDWASVRRRGVRTINRQVADPNPPEPNDEAIRQARFEADQAKARADKLAREMDDLKKQLPTEEQRARYAELEAQHAKAEEERLKKEGDFNSWRAQVQDKHEKEIQAERSMRENAEAKSRQTEKELEDTLVSREFADASELFGPTGKTVLLPEVARSFFADHVEVQVAERNGRQQRRVVVKDQNGAVILDTKTGQPASFSKAMGDLIESHPRKEHLLRNSGKVGSGSPGGLNGAGGNIDVTRLRPKDFADPKVRDAVREQSANAGGMQIGPAFDRMRRAGTK